MVNSIQQYSDLTTVKAKIKSKNLRVNLEG